MNNFAKIIIKLSIVSLILLSPLAKATLITSQVGIPAVTGSTGDGSLTDGWVENTNFSWTHVYNPIEGTIESATLTIDIIDADNGNLSLYTGINNSGLFVGNASGNDNGNGTRGIWQGLDGNAIENIIILPETMFLDLADGVFRIFGENNGLVAWGSNRALLEIEVSSVPVPSALWLFGTGVICLLGRLKNKIT